MTKICDLWVLPDGKGCEDTIHLKEEGHRCYILKRLIPDFAFVWRKCHRVFHVLPQSSHHIQLMELPISPTTLNGVLRTETSLVCQNMSWFCFHNFFQKNSYCMSIVRHFLLDPPSSNLLMFIKNLYFNAFLGDHSMTPSSMWVAKVPPLSLLHNIYILKDKLFSDPFSNTFTMEILQLQ